MHPRKAITASLLSLSALGRPEYLLRPLQIYLRCKRALQRNKSLFEVVTLPWGTRIIVRPADSIGWSICATGIYDLCVTEIIWRLIGFGETAVDVGANIGYMTSIMAVRAGAKGKVYAFEAHPGVFSDLRKNVGAWGASPAMAEIIACRVAIGNKRGAGFLVVPDAFSTNRGVSSVNAVPERGGRYESEEVELDMLDHLLDKTSEVHMLKIDVEGKELEVLQGAERLIKSGQVRDILFENHANYPNAVTEFLEKRRYKIYDLGKGLSGPVVEPVGSGRVSKRDWEPRNLLATRDETRIARYLATQGWQSLRGRGI